jgi:hypothetical protein
MPSETQFPAGHRWHVRTSGGPFMGPSVDPLNHIMNGRKPRLQEWFCPTVVDPRGIQSTSDFDSVFVSLTVQWLRACLLGMDPGRGRRSNSR